MTFAVGVYAFLAAAVALPVAPADGFRDDARVFGTETLQALVKEREVFRQETGLELFVDTNTYLQGDQTSGERTRALLRHWSGNKRAVILSVERTARGLPMLHVSPDLWQRYSEPELIKALRLAADQMGRQNVSEASIAAGVRILMRELTRLELLAKQRSSSFQRADMLFAAAFGGVLMIGSFVVMILAQRQRHGERQRTRQHYFPEVEVGQRLGAPCGGGVLAEMSFGILSPPT